MHGFVKIHFIYVFTKNHNNNLLNTVSSAVRGIASITQHIMQYIFYNTLVPCPESKNTVVTPCFDTQIR